MTPCTPLRRPRTRAVVLAGLVGLAAPVAAGLVADAAVSAPAAHHALASHGSRDVAQRYIVFQVNKKVVVKGKKVTLHGQVMAPPEAPACASGVVLTVERATNSAVFKTLGTVTTDGVGNFSVKETVKKKARYRVATPATDSCSEVSSDSRTVDVKKKK